MHRCDGRGTAFLRSEELSSAQAGSDGVRDVSNEGLDLDLANPRQAGNGLKSVVRQTQLYDETDRRSTRISLA